MPAQFSEPEVHAIVVAYPSSTGGANLITFSGLAHFVQITNLGGHTIQVKLGDCATTFSLGAGDTQSFNSGDLNLRSVDFSNGQSGGTTAPVEVIAGILS